MINLYIFNFVTLKSSWFFFIIQLCNYFVRINGLELLAHVNFSKSLCWKRLILFPIYLRRPDILRNCKYTSCLFQEIINFWMKFSLTFLCCHIHKQQASKTFLCCHIHEQQASKTFLCCHIHEHWTSSL